MLNNIYKGNNPFKGIPIHKMHRCTMRCEYQRWRDANDTHGDVGSMKCFVDQRVKNIENTNCGRPRHAKI